MPGYEYQRVNTLYLTPIMVAISEAISELQRGHITKRGPYYLLRANGGLIVHHYPVDSKNEAVKVLYPSVYGDINVRFTLEARDGFWIASGGFSVTYSRDYCGPAHMELAGKTIKRKFGITTEVQKSAVNDGRPVRLVIRPARS